MTKIQIDNDSPTFAHVTATGTSFADAAPITRLSEEMVILVASSATADPRPGVIMPAAALIGDYIEIHTDPASINPTGSAPEYFVYNEVGDIISVNGNAAFRKVETTSDHLTWAQI